MRILHIANFSIYKNHAVYYSIDRKISNGLIRNGHFVADFSYRDIAKYSAFLRIKKLGIKKMHKKIFSAIENIEPDLILFGHSELVDTDVLKIIKEKYPNIKLAMWWVDWLKNITSIKNKIEYLDVLFTTTSVNVIDQSLLRKDLLISYLPNMCDSSIESYRAFENRDYKYDLFFAGRLDLDREKFLMSLKKQLNSEINFKLFGNTKDTLLQGNEFLKTISESKMSINLSRDHDTSLYTSDRIIQLLANGSLVFSKNIPNFELLFDNDEIVFFDDIKDCIEKIEFYNQKDELRREIAFKSWKKTHKAYNSIRVTKFMIETIFNDKGYSEEYEWQSEIINSKGI